MKFSVQTAFAIMGVVALCLLSGVAGGALTRHFAASSYEISYVDFVSIMLTAISVLLALVAFIVTLLAVVGWSTLSSGIRSRVDENLAKRFAEDGDLYAMLQKRVEDAAYSGVSTIDDVEDSDEGSGRGVNKDE